MIRENLRVPQGADFQISFDLYQQDGTLVPALVGWTARGQIREFVDDEEMAFEWTPDLVTYGSHTITMYIPAEDSFEWGFECGVYDIEAVDPYGKTIRVAQGMVLVDPNVTR